MIFSLDLETVGEGATVSILSVGFFGKNYKHFYLFKKNDNLVNIIFECLPLGKNTIVVFNSKFDTRFIHLHLLYLGFKINQKKKELKENEYNVIEKNNIYYSLTYKYGGQTNEIIDLFNIYPGYSLEKIGYLIGLKKLDLDTKNIKNYTIDEIGEYNIRDAEITYIAYINFLKMTKKNKIITIGQYSFMCFNDILKHDSFYIQQYGFKKTMDYNDDAYFRKYYKGGLNTVYKCGLFKKIVLVDICSAYPAIFKMFKLPIFKTKITIKTNIRDLFKYIFRPNKTYFIELTGVTYKLKRGFIPSYMGRGRLGVVYNHGNNESVYLIKYGCYWSEFDDFFYNYDVLNAGNDVIINVFNNDYITGANDFVDKFFNLKNSENIEAEERDNYKRILNSLTGKLGSNPVSDVNNYYIDDDNKLKKEKIGEDRNKKSYAVHVISVITERIRSYMLYIARLYGLNNVINVKTDGLTLIYNIEGLKKISDFFSEKKELGKLTVEKRDFCNSISLKAYQYLNYGKKTETKLSGLNYKKSANLDFLDLNFYNVFIGNKSRIVGGGVGIFDIPITFNFNYVDYNLINTGVVGNNEIFSVFRGEKMKLDYKYNINDDYYNFLKSKFERIKQISDKLKKFDSVKIKFIEKKQLNNIKLNKNNIIYIDDYKKLLNEMLKEKGRMWVKK